MYKKEFPEGAHMTAGAILAFEILFPFKNLYQAG